MRTKHVILFIALLTWSLASCTKDDPEFNYPSGAIQDEEFKKYLLEQFDTNRDGFFRCQRGGSGQGN